MNSFRRPAACLTLAMFAALALRAEGNKAPSTDEEAAKTEFAVSLAGFEDAGEFSLFVNEDRLGTCAFQWKKDGSFTSSFALTMAGQTVRTETALTPDARGVWKSISVKAPTGLVTAERDGCLLRREFRGEKSTGRLNPVAYPYDNYMPALLSVLLKAYDVDKKGKQAFTLFAIPGACVDATLEWKSAEERRVGGRDTLFQLYTLVLSGIDIILWADASGRVVLEDVPIQKAYFARKGYESLAVKPQDDPLLSKASFDVDTTSDIMVPMRDGVRLATDLYLPKGALKSPLVFIRTPYGKRMGETSGRYWARRGYACAIQDCRGRFASQGKWTPFFNEADDGYDAVEWLAARPWCTGKVGMIGGSYVGWVQWWAASRKPPHLTTIIPNVAPPDPHFNIPYERGAFFLLGAAWWAKILESNATADLSGAAMLEVNDSDYAKILATLPVIELDKVLLGKENPYWRSWIQHPDRDAFWKSANFSDGLKGVKIPVFHQSGWFDGDGIGTKLNYLKLKDAGSSVQKMVVGPWGHTDRASRQLGDRDFGPGALLDLEREYLRWFDHYLKGVDNGIDKGPLVSLFVMGANAWKTGNVYPLEGTRFEKLYLSSGGRANTGKGDGTLVWEPGKSPAEKDAYVYDPGDPTPDPEFVPPKSKEERVKQVFSDEELRSEAKGYHRKTTDTRADILVYETPALEKPLTICGPLSAVLYASTSAKDTDWYVSLSQVDPGGEIISLCRGKIRARYRRSLEKPELLAPGEVEAYQLDLWHTGITFPAGSRVRVEVASALFPSFSRNLNTGGRNEMETAFVKADQVVFHSARYPSHVLLPVVETPAKPVEK